MRRHRGVHPRIGAVDVVPLVPVQGLTMSDCMELSRLIGKDFSTQLSIPVFFYDESATLASAPGFQISAEEASSALRHLLSSLTLARITRILPPGNGRWRTRTPSRIQCHPRYPDLELAKLIARKLRNGEAELNGVKSIGLRLASRSQVQVSMNLTHPELTPLAKSTLSYPLGRTSGQGRNRGKRNHRRHPPPRLHRHHPSSAEGHSLQRNADFG